MNKENIKFEGYMIQKFLLEKIDNIKKEEQGNINLEYSFYTSNKSKELYRVSLNLITYTDNSKIDLTLDGIFNIPNNIDENIKQDFLTISAPAIIYPYMRTFISNVTSFDIDKTVILPILNFSNIKFKKDNL